MSNIFQDYSFGGWLRTLRVKNNIGLREAAKLLKMDAGNLSKLERSELAPPKTAVRVKEICEVLKIESIELMLSLAFQHHVSALQKDFEDSK